MHVVIIIGAMAIGVIVIAAAVMIGRRYDRRIHRTAEEACKLRLEQENQRRLIQDRVDREAAREKVETLLDSIEVGDVDALLRLDTELFNTLRGLISAHNLGSALRKQLYSAIGRADEERAYRKAVGPVAELLHAWHEALADRELEALNLLNSMIASCPLSVQDRLASEMSFTQRWLDARMKFVIIRHYDRLVSNLTNAGAVRELHEFILHSRRTRSCDEDAGGGFGRYNAGLRYPAGWFTTVATLVYDPPLALFGDIDNKLGAGHLRQWASDTLARDDASRLTDAKLILAYCDNFEGHRQYVGEILYAELSKLVSTLQPEGAGHRA